MKEKLFKNMGYLVALLDVAIYFIVSYIFIEDFMSNIASILFNGGLLFIGAMIANSAMMKQGLLNGAESSKYIETVESHIKQKQKIFPKLSKLQLWLDANYSKLMEIGRTVYVNSAGFDYEQIFTEKGKIRDGFKVKKPDPYVKDKWWKKSFWPIITFFRWLCSDDWKIYRKRKKYIRQAKRYKITRLTVSDLINVDADKDPNNFGISESQYIKNQTGMAVITRLIFSIFLPSISFGFYGFNMDTFIVQLLNIALIILSSVFSMFSAYVFKTRTHRNSIIKKVNKMEEFDNANLQDLENEEVRENVSICSEKCSPTQSNLVEEIPGEGELREEDNICSNSNSGV